LASPPTLVPFVLGASLLIGAWAVSFEPLGIAAFVAICMMLLSVAIFVTRFATGCEKVTKEVVDQLGAEARKARDQALDVLQQRLTGDGDERTEQYLQDLRTLTADLTGDGDGPSLLPGIDAGSSFEIVSRVEDLFNRSVDALERSLDLATTAGRVSTEAARQPILKEREVLVDEVGKNIAQLGRSVADIRRIGSGTGTDSELAAVREELDNHIKEAEAVRAEVSEWRKSFAAKGTRKWGSEAEFLKAADELE